MSQTRLHVTAPRQVATGIYGALEQAFEDDGFPLAIIEVDETKDIHEVSLYVDEHDLGRVEAEMRRIICLLYTSPSPRDGLLSRMPSSA